MNLLTWNFIVKTLWIRLRELNTRSIFLSRQLSYLLSRILILGKNSQHGKIGISKSFELLVPNGFELVEIVNDNVEAIFVNKRILKKMTKEKILTILEDKVFPFIAEGELLRVNFRVTLSYSNIEHEF